jgi:hypothetical protein
MAADSNFTRLEEGLARFIGLLSEFRAELIRRSWKLSIIQGPSLRG